VTSDQLGSARLSTAFAAFRPVAFTLRFPSVGRGLTTLLSIAQSRCRPTASSVCTLPLSLRVGEYPLAANHPAPGSYSAALVRSLARAFRLSPSDFPRGVSRFLSSGFQPHGSQGHVGQVTISGVVTYRMLRYAYHPCRYRPAAQPDRLPSSVRHPNRLGVLGPTPPRGAEALLTGFMELTRQLQVLFPSIAACVAPDGPVLSRAPAPRWALLRYSRGRNPTAYSVCRLPLYLRSTVRRFYRSSVRRWPASSCEVRLG